MQVNRVTASNNPTRHLDFHNRVEWKGDNASFRKKVIRISRSVQDLKEHWNCGWHEADTIDKETSCSPVLVREDVKPP